MFAAIVLPNFSLQAALRHEPERLACPIALVDGADAKAVVLQSTAEARAAGVEEGMTPAQALARCPQIVIRARSHAQEQAAQATLLQCAHAFSPSIESTAPGICTMGLKGLPVAAAFDPALGQSRPGETFSEAAGRNSEFAVPVPALRAWGMRLVEALARLQLRAHVGMGATPALAQHAARVAEPVLVVDEPSSFLAQQPIEHLGAAPATLEILRRWGIRTFGEFVALGSDRVTARLGPEALELFERATASEERPLDVVQPPDTFEETTEFATEIESLEPLLFTLRRFLDQIARRLELVYLVAEEITLCLSLSSGDRYERVFRVPAPTRNVETLFRMLDTHLENLRTEAPVTGLQLSAKPCHAEGHQLALFEAPLRDPNHFSETLARLGALVGSDRVGTPALEPSHRPDHFRMETVRFESGDAATERKRPRLFGQSATELEVSAASRRVIEGPALRRFRPPMPITVQLENDTPSLFHHSTVKARIARCSGPWRSSGHWWEQGWSREEWDVETTQGRGYRLYCEGDHWFLDGVFD